MHSYWLLPEIELQGLELGQSEDERTSLVYDITTNYLPILLARTLRQAQLTDATVWFKKREGYEWLSVSK